MPSISSIDTLAVALVQMAETDSLQENHDKILRFTAEAAAAECQVVMFPEGALNWEPRGTARSAIDAAVSDVHRAAAEHRINVIFGLKYRGTTGADDESAPQYNQMYVADRAGNTLLRYNKLSDAGGDDRLPGLLHIDGVPCHVIICSDRWLRGVQELPVMAGAKVIFEIANGGSNGWFDQLDLFRYVPLAQRTGAYVLICNSADMPSWYPLRPAHGHSAAVAPDGTVMFRNGGERDVMRIVRLDLARADLAEARRRAAHPALAPFWQLGLDLMAGGAGDPRAATVGAVGGERGVGGSGTPGAGGDATGPARSRTSAPATITVAAAQLECGTDITANLAAMVAAVGAAGDAGADLVALPELALTGPGQDQLDAATEPKVAGALERLRAAAAAGSIVVAAGMPWRVDGRLRNRAVVIGADGELLTTYDQLAATSDGLFEPGTSPADMWFQVRGAWAVVTVGGDGLWNELAELAAVAGAQLHVHLSNDNDASAGGALRRTQRWIHLAQYRTLTVAVNVAAGGGSAIFDDLRREKQDPGDVELFMPYHANVVVRCGTGAELITATRRVSERNPHLAERIAPRNASMTPWYEHGARLIGAERRPSAALSVAGSR